MIASRALVVGFGITGHELARALVARGADVVVAQDDHPSDEQRRRAELIGVELVAVSSDATWRALVEGRDALLPSPGVPETHVVFDAAAAGHVPVLSEFDLAGAWDDRPVLAITGTNGKTTVTTMVTEMMNASGRRAAAVGNTDVKLVTALDDPGLDVFVAEASSFALGYTRHFEPLVATWLNFAPDHLDQHRSLASYEAAKARIWGDLDASTGGTAVANADDETVMRHRNQAIPTVCFTLLSPRPPAAYAVVDDELQTDEGTPLVTVGELHRALPHDIANALAASATALAGGATLSGVRDVLRSFRGLPHRVELVAERDGVQWFDDSKSTTPHSTLAAVRGFDSAVLLAGGRNKGLDLTVLAELAPRLRGVVAFGEAREAVAAAFGETRVLRAATLVEAVDLAAGLARAGDAVVLSPGCTSFDEFTSYAQRGDVYAAEVRRLLGADPEKVDR